MGTKIDLYKDLKEEYRAARAPAMVTVGRAQYLAIEGKGKPGGELFQEQIGALYCVAYTAKFASKFAGRDFKVCQLEGLYECADKAGEFRWTLLIRVPDFIGRGELSAAVKQLLEKGKSETVKQVQLRKLSEGRCVQALHVGPYAEVAATIQKLTAFAAEQGLQCTGPQHEVYLSDPRRVAEEKLRTVLRYPVRKA